MHSNISQTLRAISFDVTRGAFYSEVPNVVIRPIESDGELDEVYRITHDAYVERGYCRPRPAGRLVHYPHLDGISETTVFVAVVEGTIVGTNSLTVDGPAGLQVDEDFKTECDEIRKEGRMLAASWRLATRNAYRDERNVIMGLIKETVMCAVDMGVLTCVFTFNPRHERVYQRLLNMKTVVRSEGTAGLDNAPAVFMRCDVENLPEWADRLRNPSSRVLSCVAG
ncbi:MAG: hypothetical protein V1809_10505 [Planctomycetota bacterium]